MRQAVNRKRQTALLDSSVQGPGPARPAVTNYVECLFIIEVVILPTVVTEIIWVER